VHICAVREDQFSIVILSFLILHFVLRRSAKLVTKLLITDVFCYVNRPGVSLAAWQ